ncbi:glycosyltransferase family 4 protein [Leptothoe sp. ISB3NOV94-8A]|uniref:Glycosyltransferase family 4 protein n=1 Tax=Adonisia turfae CCMR0081 TaxID=2292702 RepID=A0A6M0REG1_9CYAN|nr:glycosyltransferase family 4 protein [Adonisia turfae]MDV3351544.1 glycosyltransferase family 4 protein [Leptothoe sp. LEGE 181152]NEZ54619.1 glycosyltransferase family 4 protein [Adonisia turfae CCMR0081]
MRVAVVHEWLASHAGSEKVVEQILQLYPDADLFSLVDFLPPEQRDFIGHRSVTTSFIQQLPLSKRAFRQYLPLMPLAVEQFDLSDYDVVISSNHAVAKGVLTAPHQLHISYVHTPIRYAWDLQHQYLQQAGLERGLKGALTRLILHYLRLWDTTSANRVDRFVANSHFIKQRVWRAYRRPATVIYPPVDISRFEWQHPRENFYLTVSRFVPYKRVDLTVAAFNQLGLPLVVIGDGSDWSRIKAMAGSNIRLLGQQPDSAVADYMQRCKGFIFPAEEDFGITPVEAQAAGAPVIAFGRGGVAETVIHGQTGILFPDQTVDSLVQAVKSFEMGMYELNRDNLRHQAEKFSIECFRSQFRDCVEQTYTSFLQSHPLE